MKLAITANLDKPEVRDFMPEVLHWLRARNVEFYLEHGLGRALNMASETFASIDLHKLGTDCEMVLAFGGDGTILATARQIGPSGVPILGVKMGGLGFLAELAPDELFSSLEDILSGNYEIAERMVLAATLSDAETEPALYALNDLVVDKGVASRLIRIKTYIDGEYLNTYIADGLIISTPTGSTAYSLAAAGPILLPSMEAIIINPLNPHSLGARPVVIPGDKEVKVEVESAAEKVQLSADGQMARELKPGCVATIRQADYRIRLVSCRHRSFYDVLRAKLSWGGDVREDT